MKMTLRTLIERICRKRVFKRRFMVGGKKVHLFVSPDAQLKYLKPGLKAFDRDLVLIAETHLDEDSCVWDIGANVGVFTYAAASIATKGTVVAVEADIWLAQILLLSHKLKDNQGRDIRILPAAVSSASSVARFLIANRGRASNALEDVGGYSQSGGVREVVYVPTTTLDAMLESFPVPDFIKIDVEGAELMVLFGASRVIRESRPTFYIEVGKERSAEIFTLFEREGYFVVAPSGDLLLGRCATNTFFVPREKTSTLAILQGCKLQ